MSNFALGSCAVTPPGTGVQCEKHVGPSLLPAVSTAFPPEVPVCPPVAFFLSTTCPFLEIKLVPESWPGIHVFSLRCLLHISGPCLGVCFYSFTLRKPSYTSFPGSLLECAFAHIAVAHTLASEG